MHNTSRRGPPSAVVRGVYAAFKARFVTLRSFMAHGCGEDCDGIAVRWRRSDPMHRGNPDVE